MITVTVTVTVCHGHGHVTDNIERFTVDKYFNSIFLNIKGIDSGATPLSVSVHNFFSKSSILKKFELGQSGKMGQLGQNVMKKYLSDIDDYTDIGKIF